MGNYLSKRRKEIGLTQREVAEAVGVAEATVSRWESGEIANMRRDKISALSKVLHCSPDFVMTGEQSAAPSIPPGFHPMPEMSNVPRVGRIACGEPILAEENIEAHDSVPSAWRADFTLVCVGDSMAPRIQDGDLVAVRKQDEVENGEIAAVRIDNEATLKRVYLSPGRMVLQPENTTYSPIILVGDELQTVHIEGKAVGLCRGI